MTEEQKQTVHLGNMRKQVASICPQVSSSEKNNDFHQSRGNRRMSSLFVEKNNDSFHYGANNWLALWLYFVASSYFLLSKKLNFFGGCSVESEEKVSLSNRSIPNERTDNVNDALCYSESLGSPHSTCSSSSTYFDVFSEISDFDRTSYLHSLLSLEEEESEWLSDSIISDNSSTCLICNSDSFTDISDARTPSYWDSLLKLEEKGSEWKLDKASYLHSLLSLEDEDSEWLSDSVFSEDPSSPLSSSGDSLTDISDVGTPRYWDSLLKLEGEDSEWNLDKASYLHSLLSLEDEDSEWLSDSVSSENPSSPLSSSIHSFIDISDVGTPSYWDSLLKLEEEDNERILDRASYSLALICLEDEDSEWLSDSMISENPSSPLSSNGDSFTDISDIGTPSYWDSLLKLDIEGISDSKQGLKCVHYGSPISSYKINWGNEVLPSVSTISSFTGPHRQKLEVYFSAENLLETPDIEELNGDEPFFWPFEGKFNWDSDESSFCSSPRKRLVFDSCSKTSSIKRCEQKGGEVFDFDSDMDIPLEYFDANQEFTIETLVGLKEFDGHEGLDSAFISDGFMLEESLQ